MTRSTMVDCGAAEIATFVDGPDGAPWIVLLNSLAATHSMWTAQIPALSARHRVLRHDARGHGASSASRAPFALSDLCADTIRIMDHHGVDTADLVGLSLGGTTALALGLDHGERFRRLVCCDANAETDSSDVARWDRRCHAVREGGVASLGDELVARWYTSDFIASNPQEVLASRRMINETQAAEYIGCATILRTLSLTSRLHDIGLPVLYVVGAQDGFAPERMRRMNQLTPLSRYVEIDPGAHLPNVESADQFNAAILDFFAR